MNIHKCLSACVDLGRSLLQQADQRREAAQAARSEPKANGVERT